MNSALIKKQLKAAKITPQMLTALCGYKTVHTVTFNNWMREGAVPAKVACFLQDKLKFKLND